MLEEVIDLFGLKQEMAELCRKNRELWERNINMHQTISLLSQSNLHVEKKASDNKILKTLKLKAPIVKIIEQCFNKTKTQKS